MKPLPLILTLFLTALAAISLTTAPTIAQATTKLPEAWVMTGSTNDGSSVYLDRNSVKRRANSVTFALKMVSPNRGFNLNRIAANCNTRHWRTTSLKVVDASGNILKPMTLPSGTARSGDPISEALRSACGY